MLDWLRDALGPGPRVRDVCIAVAQRLDDSLSVTDRPMIILTSPAEAPREFRTQDKASGTPLTPPETVELMRSLLRVAT